MRDPNEPIQVEYQGEFGDVLIVRATPMEAALLARAIVDELRVQGYVTGEGDAH